MNWSQRLQERGSALCVGLDPVESRLPDGCTIASFCEEVIDRTAEYASCFKPNVAFFERHGADGFDALARAIAAAREAGVPVIVDAKRGDVGSTARLYAETYLGDTPYAGDALTVNPSLGLDTLEPFLELARRHDRGIFVLLRTSNPGAAQFQEAMEPTLLSFLADEPHAGAVVGSTDPEAGARLRAALPETLFLVPGFGAQGGGELAPFFNDDGRGAVVNSSRGIIYADDIAAAARQATETIKKARTR
ncbi:MAG: orotidine-5'-phosphate decarboxylase [Planctomycetota bacterium]